MINSEISNSKTTKPTTTKVKMTKAKLLIGLLWFTALTLATWTLSQLPLRSIFASLKGLSLPDYLVWGLVNLIIIFIFNYRWWLLGKAINAPLRFWQLLMIRQAGQSISFITPGPQFGGEPLQIYWLWRTAKIGLHKALLSLGLDRFLELWVNFAVLVISVLLLMLLPESNATNWNTVLLVLTALLILFSLAGSLLLKQPQWIIHRLNNVTHRWKSHRHLESIKTQWSLLSEDLIHCFRQQKKILSGAILLSVAGWAGLFIELTVLLGMTGVNIGFGVFLLLFAALRLALLLPLPGGVGTLEAAVFWVFQLSELPMESALTFIALMRLRDIVVLLFGLGCAGVLQSRMHNTVKQTDQQFN